MGESIKVIAKTGRTRLGSLYCIARSYAFRWAKAPDDGLGEPHPGETQTKIFVRAIGLRIESEPIHFEVGKMIPIGAYDGPIFKARGPATTPATRPFKGPRKSRKARGL